MPKVSKMNLKLKSTYGEDYEIWYNAKQKPLFSISGLPPDFENVTNCKTYGYETESILTNSMYGAVQRYKKAKEQCKKVIVYSASATPELTANKISQGHYQGFLKGISKKFSSFGHGAETASFGFSYSVKMEVDHVNTKKYHSIKEDGSLGWEGDIYHKSQVMDWTPERELFFESIYDSMRLLTLKISSFIDKDSENASIMIDTKQNLLS